MAQSKTDKKKYLDLITCLVRIKKKGSHTSMAIVSWCFSFNTRPRAFLVTFLSLKSSHPSWAWVSLSLDTPVLVSNPKETFFALATDVPRIPLQRTLGSPWQIPLQRPWYLLIVSCPLLVSPNTFLTWSWTLHFHVLPLVWHPMILAFNCWTRVPLYTCILSGCHHICIQPPFRTCSVRT